MKMPTYPTNPTPTALEIYKRKYALWYATVWDEWGGKPWTGRGSVPRVRRRDCARRKDVMCVASMLHGAAGST